MGLYLNPNGEMFERMIKSNDYVDKTGLIRYMNGRIGQMKNLIASTRPRRFGKTLAAQMLTAYYSKGCDSRELFKGLEIESDASFEEHLNKYDVISLDIQEMRSVYLQTKNKSGDSVLDFIQVEILNELRETYPECVSGSCTVAAQALAQINNAVGNKFIIIIDEWDCFFREEKDNKTLIDNYIIFLRSLFKGMLSDRFVALAYITGILPIKKYGTQSALNNFREHTMVSPGKIAKYIGFTEDEVRVLCAKNDMSFPEMQRWYDGYVLSNIGHIYSPNSVMEAIDNEEFQSYWSQTEAYEDLKMYIEMDYDGLKQKIIDMLGGGRCKIDALFFQNDMTSFKSSDDVLTLLIHLGYLAYDMETEETFIPNNEVRSVFVYAVKNGDWGDVYNAMRDSEKLLNATLAKDESTVAKMIQEVHMKNSSSLVYNSEISLASVIQAAYYTAVREYTLFREFPSGDGFADMVFVPKRNSDKPALVVELKWDESAEGAIDQIKDRKYASILKEYEGNILLVGINYDKKTKEHQCRIEEYIK